MAMPQTHLVVSGLVRIILLFVFKVKFSFWELFSFYFWSIGPDIDHFFSWSYTKDVFKVQLPGLFRNRITEPLSLETKMPFQIFHVWSVIPFMVLYFFVFNFILRIAIPIWIIVFPWLIHRLVDDFRNGYPVRTLTEFILFTLLAMFLIVFEVLYNL